MTRTRIDSTHEHRQRQIIQDDDNAPIVTGASSAVVSADDPGAVGAGGLWLDTTQDQDNNLVWFQLKVRNATDDGWVLAGFAETIAQSLHLNTWGGVANPDNNAFVDLGPVTPSTNTGVYGADGMTSVHTDNDGIVFNVKGVVRATMVAAQGLHLGDTSAPSIFSGSGDPSAGLAAPQGSLFVSTAGVLWVKTGAGDTDWDQVAFVP